MHPYEQLTAVATGGEWSSKGEAQEPRRGTHREMEVPLPKRSTSAAPFGCVGLPRTRPEAAPQVVDAQHFRFRSEGSTLRRLALGLIRKVRPEQICHRARHNSGTRSRWKQFKRGCWNVGKPGQLESLRLSAFHARQTTLDVRHKGAPNLPPSVFGSDQAACRFR